MVVDHLSAVLLCVPADNSRADRCQTLRYGRKFTRVAIVAPPFTPSLRLRTAERNYLSHSLQKAWWTVGTP